MSSDQAKRTSVRIGGSVTGQVSVGDGNTQYWQQVRAAGPVTSADLVELRAAIAEVREALAGELPEVAGSSWSEA